MKNNNKTTTTVKIPSWVNDKLQHAVISDRYGMRGKSKWIIEAIESFLDIDGFWDIVNIADDIDEHNSTLSLRLTDDLASRLEQSVILVRKHFPLLEGVKSRIIRSSIFQRLIRSGVDLVE